MRLRSSLVLSCEHATARVPRRYRTLFARDLALLATHRAVDLGALALARHLARTLHAPLVTAKATRLLVDPNRSVGHPRLFSELTRRLDEAARLHLLTYYYEPHRRAVHRAVAGRLARGDLVVHLGVHTFTPVLHGRVRRTDVGLLYDPARPRERRFCRTWQLHLEHQASALVVRRNDPYRGAADGLTTALRRTFPAGRYLGIELEVNQRLPLGPPAAWREVQRALAATLAETLYELAAMRARKPSR